MSDTRRSPPALEVRGLDVYYGHSHALQGVDLTLDSGVFSVVGRAADVDGAWRTASVSLDAYAGQTIHVLFQAADGGAPNLLEVQLDDVRVTRPG